MAERSKKISELTALPAASSDDLLVIVNQPNTANATTLKITVGDFFGNVYTNTVFRENVTVNGSFTVANNFNLNQLTVGSSSVNTAVNSSLIAIGTAFVNTQINSTSVRTLTSIVTGETTSGNVNIIGYANVAGSLSGGNTTVSGSLVVGGQSLLGNTSIVGYANVAVDLNVGSNVKLSTTTLKIGNSSSNATINSTGFFIDGISVTVGGGGIKGEKGDIGDKGDTGAGEKGEKGGSGDKGDLGTKGDKGDTGGPGAKGDQGDKGDTGTIGAKGDKGDFGEKGNTGDKGDQGGPGAKGEPGEKGSIGSTGLTGLKGDKGEVGSKGDTGSKGDKGDKGDVGEKGAKGESIANATYSDANNTTVFVNSDSSEFTITGIKGQKGEVGALTVSTGPSVAEDTAVTLENITLRVYNTANNTNQIEIQAANTNCNVVVETIKLKSGEAISHTSGINGTPGVTELYAGSYYLIGPDDLGTPGDTVLVLVSDLTNSKMYRATVQLTDSDGAAMIAIEKLI